MLLLLGTVGGALGAALLTARIYTDLLWFDELGHEDVFWTTLKWKLLAGGVVGLGTASFLLLNLAVAEWVISRAGPRDLRGPAALLWRYRRLTFPVVAVAAGVVSTARRPEAGWQQLLLWIHRGDFGVQDPVFHRDVGFYVFSLPVYREVNTWLLETGAMAIAATLLAYLSAGALGSGRRRALARAGRAHLLLLFAGLLLVLAWRFRLDQLSLVVPRPGSTVPGASYTDVRIRRPMLAGLIVLALAGATLCVYAAMRRLPYLALTFVAVLAVVGVAGVTRVPALFERVEVQPQALSRERPYLAQALVSTREAYGLDDIRVRELSGSGDLSAEEVDANRRTIANVPLWDPAVVGSAMNELETIGSYYRFATPSVDRYTIDGVRRVLTVAARQLDLTRLDHPSRSWANEHFAYTHGYGVVGIQAGGMDSERFPSFAQREFAGSNPLGVRQPRIYYGERDPSDPPYRIVRSGRGEVEEPAPGSRSSRYHYEGSGGIPLSTRLRRAAFAARFGDMKLLLSETVTSESRIVVHRDVRDRLVTLAPFLRWDERPQTAVVDGRIVYLFHGYTTSDDYPYSAPVQVDGSRLNYIREAARASVDAYDGRVTIYAADSTDPILKAWEAAYPTLFQPASSMPRGLRAHLRYPETLFSAQMDAYKTYHAADVTAFWTGSDVWQRPLQLAGPLEAAGEIHFPDPERAIDTDERDEGQVTADVWRMQPDYVFAQLPGDSTERFLLATAFTPRGRQNLVSYVAGSIDSHGRPALTAVNLPRDRLTIGPAQVTRRILASPMVNRRLELLNRESRDLGKSSVLRTVLGDPRVVPLRGQLMTVQPVYLSAGGAGVPRLQLVAVHAFGRVSFGRNLAAAFRRMLRVEALERARSARAARTRERQRPAP